MTSRNIFFTALVLTFVVSTRVWAWGDWSVWQTAKHQAYGSEGRIKAIAVDEEANEIIVKFEPAGSTAQVQSVRVCNQDSDVRYFQKSEKMALLRQAFDSGSKVHVSFSGPFDRCLSAIEYERPTEKVSARSDSNI